VVGRGVGGLGVLGVGGGCEVVGAGAGGGGEGGGVGVGGGGRVGGGCPTSHQDSMTLSTAQVKTTCSSGHYVKSY